jgi:hypothetical protein
MGYYQLFLENEIFTGGVMINTKYHQGYVGSLYFRLCLYSIVRYTWCIMQVKNRNDYT